MVFIGRVEIIPNGVSTGICGEYQKPPWPEEFGDGYDILLFLGRLHPKKNLTTLLESFAILCNRGVSPTLEVCGRWLG